MTDALKITRLIVSSLTNSDSEDDGELPLRTSRKDTLWGKTTELHRQRVTPLDPNIDDGKGAVGVQYSDLIP